MANFIVPQGFHCWVSNDAYDWKPDVLYTAGQSAPTNWANLTRLFDESSYMVYGFTVHGDDGDDFSGWTTSFDEYDNPWYYGTDKTEIRVSTATSLNLYGSIAGYPVDHIYIEETYYYAQYHMIFPNIKTIVLNGGTVDSLSIQLKSTLNSISGSINVRYDYRLESTSNLTSLPNVGGSYGSMIINGCGLTSITIPNTVSELALYNMPSLTTVNYSPSTTYGISFEFLNLGLTSINNSYLSKAMEFWITNCPITSLNITASLSLLGYIYIKDCSSLSSITWPESGYSYFGIELTIDNCDLLDDNDIHNIPISSISTLSIQNCSGIKNISAFTYTDKLSILSFKGCENLESIENIPSSVTNLTSAFENCTSLHGWIEYNPLRNVVSVRDCFKGTTNDILLSGYSNIPALQSMAETATNGNVYVNYTPVVLINGTRVNNTSTIQLELTINKLDSASILDLFISENDTRIYPEWTITGNVYTTTLTNRTVSETFSYETYLQDSYATSAKRRFMVQTVFKTFNFYPGGKTVAFGTFADPTLYKRIWPTQEDFEFDKTHYYTESEGVYTQCTSSSVYDELISYYEKNVIGIFKCGMEAKFRANDGIFYYLLDYFYPPGSIYKTLDPTFDPNERWGGVWELISDYYEVGGNVTGGLEGTSWEFEMGLTLPISEHIWHFNFTAGGTDFIGIEIGNGILKYHEEDTSFVAFSYDRGWIYPELTSIEISGGEDADNFQLIQFITRNASNVDFYMTRENVKFPGCHIDAGLPNITGSLRLQWGDASGGGIIMQNDHSGALYSSASGSAANYYSASLRSYGYNDTANIDASQSNDIYGRSDTVRPESIITNTWLRTK